MRETRLIKSGVAQANTGQTTIFEVPAWAKFALFHFNVVAAAGNTPLTDLAFKYASRAVTAAVVVATTQAGGGGNNETQTITLTGGPTGGRWYIAFTGVSSNISVTTEGLTPTATAAEVQDALYQALQKQSTYDAANSPVTVSRSGAGTSGDPYVYTLTFTGGLGNLNVDAVTVNGAELYTEAATALNVAGWDGVTQIAGTTAGIVQIQMGPGVTGIADDDTGAFYSVNTILPQRMAAVIALDRTTGDETYTYSLYVDFTS